MAGASGASATNCSSPSAGGSGAGAGSAAACSSWCAAGVMLAAGAVRGVEPDRPRPQTGQAPRPCPASTFSATAICCSLVARWADGAY
ncbi:hypothetical protein E3G59_000851 [Mycobacteroides abscessus]|nr:hypothetical protein [Mycobacteroides abscessus]SHP68419.1 Uncharacterised protein [Mycobacteroides abscessus subsp. abscessus]SKF69512.1 Uncharacterised protein [Mycobacteroides abscessus subsp. bolletii]SKS43960.1 Uncharacterised protein [Mycobacteroides abscessus subsp. massiliense]MBE5467027.1 hypothetical protein [Mycobacteroides abscessus]